MTEIIDLSKLRQLNEAARLTEKQAALESVPEGEERARNVARYLRELASEERESMILEYLIRLDERLARIESKIEGGNTNDR